MKKIKHEIYVVQEGDSLDSIARNYKLNPTQILIQNKIGPKLKKGMVIFLSHCGDN